MPSFIISRVDTDGERAPTLWRKAAMNVEQLDGFLVALICCPSDVAKSDYLPEIRSHISNQRHLLWHSGE
jgi:yecA family protein